MKKLILKLKILLKDKILLGFINRLRFGPRRKTVSLAEMKDGKYNIAIQEIFPVTHSELIIDPTLLSLTNVTEIENYKPQYTINPVYIADQ